MSQQSIGFLSPPAPPTPLVPVPAPPVAGEHTLHYPPPSGPMVVGYPPPQPLHAPLVPMPPVPQAPAQVSNGRPRSWVWPLVAGLLAVALIVVGAVAFSARTDLETSREQARQLQGELNGVRTQLVASQQEAADAAAASEAAEARAGEWQANADQWRQCGARLVSTLSAMAEGAFGTASLELDQAASCVESARATYDRLDAAGSSSTAGFGGTGVPAEFSSLTR